MSEKKDEKILDYAKNFILSAVEKREVVIYKTFQISAGHYLDLDYESPCKNPHGHDYKVELWIKGDLDSNHMVADFQEIKKTIAELFDHKDLNEVFEINDLPLNPTAEVLAIMIYYILKMKYSFDLKVKVRIWETNSSYAEFGDKIEND